MITVENVIHRLRTWAEAHKMIKVFTHGQEPDKDLDKGSSYPLMHAVLLDVTTGAVNSGSITYSLQVSFLDKPTIEEDKNEQSLYALNDCVNYALDLVATIKNETANPPIFGDDFVLAAWNIQALQEVNSHVLWGATMNLQLEVDFTHNYCDVPIAPISGQFDPCTLCGLIENATVLQIIECLSAEQLQELQDQVCGSPADARYENSDGSFGVDIPSGGTFVSDDIEVEDIDGSTRQVPSNVGVVCEWKVINVRSTDGVGVTGGTIATYPAGGNADILFVRVQQHTGTPLIQLPFRGNIRVANATTLSAVELATHIEITLALINVINSDGLVLFALPDFIGNKTLADTPLSDDNGAVGNFPVPTSILIDGEVDTASYSAGQLTIKPATPPCDPVTIEIDGNDEGNVDSGNTAEIFIEDTDSNPVTPTGVSRVGDQFTITVPAGAVAPTEGTFALGNSRIDVPIVLNDYDVPLFINGKKFTKISYGVSHFVAICTDGALWVCGNQANGRLGNGETTGLGSLQQIGSDTDWTDCAAGSFWSLAIRAGRLYATGINSNGQHGDGTTTLKTVFTQIGTDTDWEQVRASNGLSVSIAIKGGDIVTCGQNSAFVTGLGTAAGNTTTWTVASSSETFTAISLGSQSGAAIGGGKLFTWGSNTNGRTAQGTTAGQTQTPTQVGSDTDWAFCEVGHQHMFAIKTGGTLWAAGQRNAGRTGDGTTGFADYLNMTQIGSDTDWLEVKTFNSLAGASVITSWGRKTDNTIWRCGDNRNGQLGAPLTTSELPSWTQYGTQTAQTLEAANGFAAYSTL